MFQKVTIQILLILLILIITYKMCTSNLILTKMKLVSILIKLLDALINF